MSPAVTREVFDVLSSTSILLLLVTGMAVIVGMMGVLNLCQGELVLLGALTTYLGYQWTGSALVGLLAAPLVVGLFGGVLERTVVHRFYLNPPGALLATFAVGYVIREVVRGRMKSQGGSVPAPVSGTFTVNGAHLSSWRLIVIIVTLLLVGGCVLLLNRTYLGLLVRATLDNPELASSSGISTRWMYAGTYAFGSALAGLAGGLIVPLQTLYPDLGLDNLIPMFIAVMVGGLGSFSGPLLGALVIGVPAGLLPAHMNPVFAQVSVVLGAIVIMRFRPAGLVSKST
jgi:branched-subunit amino acid ABC-type transport system permease component